MPENEIIFRTNLDFEETVKRLRECSELKVQYDPELKPQGICHISYKSVRCNIGRNGGVQIHWDGPTEYRCFLKLIYSLARYPTGTSPSWVIERVRYGRTYYMNKVARFQRWIEDLGKYNPLDLSKIIDKSNLIRHVLEPLKWAPFHTKAEYNWFINFATPIILETLKRKKRTQLYASPTK